ncbi:hypothetical protein R69919_00775 [Paraburkholderia gardini]|nr:hypothetical protein R69919_00775 [Paraburkholderia gardini]
MTDEQIDTTALREHAGKGWGDDCLLPKASVNRMADELDSLRALLSASNPAALPFETLKALWKNGSDNRDLLEGSMAHAFALRIFAAQNAATPAAPAQPCGEDAANVAMLLTAEQKSALSQAADVMGANGFHWVEDTLRDLIAGANGAIGEREAFLTWWCEDVPEYMREKWKESVDECLRDNRATDKLVGAWDGFQFGLTVARAALPAEKVAQAEPVAWRTKEFVMSRLQEAAKEPPSKRSVGNADRLAGDIWRTVLLSDLQEIVRHAAAPQSTQSPDGRVIDKAMVKRLAVQHGLLPAQTERAMTLDEYHEDYGFVVWWAWQDGEWLGEPAWIGAPSDSDWPGYHTHWTKHPAFPAAAQPASGGDHD